MTFFIRKGTIIYIHRNTTLSWLVLKRGAGSAPDKGYNKLSTICFDQVKKN